MPVVVVGDERVALRAAELPGQLAPERADHGAVGLGVRGAGRDLLCRPAPRVRRRRRRFSPASASTALDARQLARRVAAGEVVEREHRVGLAAAEVGLELDDRVAALACETPDGVDAAGSRRLSVR